MTKTKVISHLYAGRLIRCSKKEYVSIRNILLEFAITYRLRDVYQPALVQITYLEMARLDNEFFGIEQAWKKDE